METLDCKTLWDEYGIVGDVLVRKNHSRTSFWADFSKYIAVTAFYRKISTRRYS